MAPLSSLQQTHPLPPWSWGKSLSAAAWPGLCALGFATYAFWPDRFPAQTSTTLLLLIAAEFPSLVIGTVHAVALGEATIAGRLKIFFAWIGTIGAILALNAGLKIDLLVAAPMLFWVLIPYVIDLCRVNDDRALARRQTQAVLEDRLHLISLIPTLLIYGMLLAIAVVVLLGGLSIALGDDLVRALTRKLGTLDPSLLALIGSTYMLVGAASAAHVHRPVFLRDGRRLLSRPSLQKAVLGKSERKAWRR